MNRDAIYRVGMLYFSNQFGSDLADRLNTMPPLETRAGKLMKVAAEHVLITELHLDYRTPYNLIIDRASHLMDQAIGILNIFAYRGVRIINNPFSFHFFIKRKDLGYAMIRDLGIPVPETIILPMKRTPDLDASDFKYHRHVDWDKVAERIGFPCVLKPSSGRGALGVSIVNSMEELIAKYDESGDMLMMVQKHIPSPYDWHVRCLCIGRTIIPIKFKFGFNDTSRYIFDDGFLDAGTGRKILEYSKVINRTFGYEMNSVEFIIDAAGEAWAIDFNNPVPDSRREVLGDIFYEDYLTAMTKLVEDAVQAEPEGFLPDINAYAEIARLPFAPEVKFKKALNLAEKYYSGH